VQPGVQNAAKSSANGVFILEQIYESRQAVHRAVPDPSNPGQTINYPDYRNGVPVPGDPTGRTLHDLYLAERELYDLPVYEPGHAQAGQPDFRLFTARDTNGTIFRVHEMDHLAAE